MSQAGTNHGSLGGGSQGHHSQHNVNQEPTPSEIHRCQNDDEFKRMMRHFLKVDREAYFLQLAQEGAKLPPNFNVEDIITQEEENPLTTMTR